MLSKYVLLNDDYYMLLSSCLQTITPNLHVDVLMLIWSFWGFLVKLNVGLVNQE